MRLTPVILAAVLFAGAGFGVQQSSEPPPQQGQERKPTLGPAPEPSLSGPRTSATMDARKLMRVRTIYVERIDNSLSEKLADGLAKMGRFRVVATNPLKILISSNKLFTFHKIVAGCEEGSRKAWEAFLADYTPIVFQLSDVYFGFSPQKQNDFWRDAVAQLSANNFDTLKRFEHQAEREFLTDLRDFLLEEGAEKLDPALDSAETPRPTPEAVLGLLKGLPLLDQEVLFFKLCGYSDATIEKILVTTPAVAQKGLERLRAEYP